jgi:hypothetical protein
VYRRCQLILVDEEEGRLANTVYAHAAGDGQISALAGPVTSGMPLHVNAQ